MEKRKSPKGLIVALLDEYGSMTGVQTHNTNLKKRMTAFAEIYP